MNTVNRRDFLIQSVSAAVAAGGLYPHRAAGAAAKDRLSVAIIGCGRLGQQYAEIYQALSPDRPGGHCGVESRAAQGGGRAASG